jgi:putative Mg2+ transporter-C (MgtC) family protein
LSLDGKDAGSFAVMDLMRLPLGILTGVGFLGGGAILKKGGSITGMTTAATLWIATVIGLCFGGGQLGLGAISTAMGMLTLWAMEWIDIRIPREHRAILVVTTPVDAPSLDLNDFLRPFGYRARLRQQSRSENASNEEQIETHFDLTWKQAESVGPSLAFIPAIKTICRVQCFQIISGGDH